MTTNSAPSTAANLAADDVSDEDASPVMPGELETGDAGETGVTDDVAVETPIGTNATAPDARGGGAVAGMWALFLGFALLMVGNGLNSTVIGIRAGTEGFSVRVTGVIMAGYFAGFLFAPSAVVRMIPAVGHIRVFAGLASTAASAVILHSVLVDPIAWMALRLVFGFCAAGLYIVIESWLNAMSDSSNRGRVLAIYMIISTTSVGVGQYLIVFADPNGFRLFVVASVLVSMSLVPVTLAATSRAPELSLPSPVSIRELVGFVPSGALGSMISGASAGVLLGLGAVYATAIDLSRQRTAFFLVAPMIGALILQWPIGRLSDRVSRRAVIFGVALVASVTSAVLIVVPAQSVAVPVLMLLVGGMLFPLYSLVVSYTLDWTPEGKTVGASGTLIRINGSGAVAGPLLTAPLMAQFGPKWFFGALTIVFGILVVFLAYRIAFKEALPMSEQTPFVPFPARATAFAIRLAVSPVRTATRIAGRRNVTVDGDPEQARVAPRNDRLDA